MLKGLQLNISLSQKIYNLSGGEQQRVALARLLLKNCEIILAEATRVVSVYDPVATADTVNPGNKIIYLTFDDGPGKYTQGLLDVLDKLNQEGKTIIMVTHDPYIVSRYRNTIWL